MKMKLYITPSVRVIDYDEPILVTVSGVTGSSDDGDFNAGDGGDDDDNITLAVKQDIWDNEW